MKIIKNFLYNISYQIFLLIVPLLTTPYVNRVIGATGVGINSFTSSIATYFILAGSIGLAIYGNREIAYARNNKNKMSSIFWEIQILRMTMMIIAILLYIIFIFFNRKYQTYYLIQGITLVAAVFDISWFFQGIENFRVTVLRNMAVKILSVVLIFTVIKSSKDLGLYIFIIGLSSLLGNLTLWLYLKEYIEKIKIKNLNIIRHLAPSLVLFIPQIATQVYMVLNRSMLGGMVSVEASGFYYNADQLVKIAMSVATAIVTVMLPRVANTFADGNMEKVHYYLRMSFKYVSFLSIPIMFGLDSISIKLAPWFLGNEFSSVGKLIILESPVIILIGWSGVIGTQYLLPIGENKKFTKSVSYGALMNIILNVPFIILWKTEGAVISTVISELTVTIVQLYYVKDRINIGKLFNGIYKYFISGLVMFVVTYFLNSILNFTIFTLVLEILLGVLIYFSLLVLLKADIILDLRSWGRSIGKYKSKS